MVAGAGGGDEVLIGGVVGVGVVLQKVALAHVGELVADAGLGEGDDVRKVDVGGDVAMTGEGGELFRAEKLVRFVAAEGARGAAVVEGVVQLAVVDGDHGAERPERLPRGVPFVVALVHLDNLPLLRPALKGVAAGQGGAGAHAADDATVRHGVAHLHPLPLRVAELAGGEGVGQLVAEDEGAPAAAFQSFFDGGVHAHELPADHLLEVAQGAGAVHHQVGGAQTPEEAELAGNAHGEVAVAAADFQKWQRATASGTGALPFRHQTARGEVAQRRGGGKIPAEADVRDIAVVIPPLFIEEGNLHELLRGQPVAVGQNMRRDVHRMLSFSAASAARMENFVHCTLYFVHSHFDSSSMRSSGRAARRRSSSGTVTSGAMSRRQLRSFSSVLSFMYSHSAQAHFSVPTGMNSLPGTSLRRRCRMPLSVTMMKLGALLSRQ